MLYCNKETITVFSYSIVSKVDGVENICWALSEEDAIDVARNMLDSISESENWQLTVYNKSSGRRDFVKGWDSKKERVSNPKSKVFIRTSGCDCDGISYASYYEFENLHEAHKEMEEKYYWSDGPMYYTTVSREEYENCEDWIGPDKFAESMGY